MSSRFTRSSLFKVRKYFYNIFYTINDNYSLLNFFCLLKDLNNFINFCIIGTAGLNQIICFNDLNKLYFTAETNLLQTDIVLQVFQRFREGFRLVLLHDIDITP